MPGLPDKLPNPPSAPFFWGGAAWDWFVKSLQTIYLAVRAQQPNNQDKDALFKMLWGINKTLEKLVMTTSDFQGSLDRNTAATGAAGAAITAEIAQLKAAIDALSTTQAPTQAQLDQLNASSNALEAATASLVADDAAPTP